MNRHQIKLTNDGSYTIFDNLFNETFHSIYGARQESLHIFINNGLLDFSSKKELNILEIGYGTGLNALLTLLHKPLEQKIYYTAIEKYPLSEDIFIRYAELLIPEEKNFYLQLNTVSWNKQHEINETFIFQKIEADILNFSFDGHYDLVYYDAFSPKVQPKMWSIEVLNKTYQCLNFGGMLITYASSGIVKQNLRTVGFNVKRVVGPPFKRHILKAYKF